MTICTQTGLRPRLVLQRKLERIKMPPWLLFPNTKNVVLSADGDFYACTQSAWASTSKFILFLVEECWGANLGVNQYSGLMKGYVCLEEFRYVWFGHNHSAGPSDIEQTQFFEGCASADKNILFWFYLPRDYRQFIHHYVDLKQLLTGRVPFKVAAEDEVVIHAFSADFTLQANSELYLVSGDSQDLLFYCIQSLHISAGNVVTTCGLNGIQNSMISEFPHHPFRCISVLQACNIQAGGAGGSDKAKLAIASEHIDEFEDVTCTLEEIKHEPDDDCDPDMKQETQQNPDEWQLQQPQGGSRHDNFPSVEARTRKTPSSKAKRNMSYRQLLCISESYGQLAAAKQYAKSKLWAGVTNRIGPTLILQCPGCGKFFPPSNPKSLWNMLTHFKSKHIKNHAEMLSSVSDALDILIPFMQKKIAVWQKRN